MGANHFLAVGKHFKGRIEIATPTTESSKNRLREKHDDPAVGYVEETQDEARNNAAIRRTRARVEQVFSSIKERFKCFKPYFTGNMEEQECAVFFGAAFFTPAAALALAASWRFLRAALFLCMTPFLAALSIALCAF